MLKPIIYLLISSSLASAAKIVPTDDYLPQAEIADVTAIQKETMVNKYLNEYLEIATTDKKAALKKTNLDLLRANKESHDALSTVKKNKKLFKKTYKILEKYANGDAEMTEMLAIFDKLKVKAFEKGLNDSTKTLDMENIIAEAQEQFLKYLGADFVDSISTSEPAEKAEEEEGHVVESGSDSSDDERL